MVFIWKSRCRRFWSSTKASKWHFQSSSNMQRTKWIDFFGGGFGFQIGITNGKRSWDYSSLAAGGFDKPITRNFT
ncbi:hypothetical protein FRX31_028417 [Thalictrum thalictroides]|uniref:Uncharacterized protein n=1 Tax=Thalictrum thalictroides TaxID=46969 RepID=A0A7J6VA83_THATH|nr:hypothetical protein FRX31_028417 [Thalictrum thalictroides]